MKHMKQLFNYLFLIATIFCLNLHNNINCANKYKKVEVQQQKQPKFELEKLTKQERELLKQILHQSITIKENNTNKTIEIQHSNYLLRKIKSCISLLHRNSLREQSEQQIKHAEERPTTSYFRLIQGQENSKIRQLCRKGNHKIFQDVIKKWLTDYEAVNNTGNTLIDSLKEKLCYCNIFRVNDSTEQVNWNVIMQNLFSKELTLQQLKTQYKDFQLVNNDVIEEEQTSCCSRNNNKYILSKLANNWKNITEPELLILYMLFINKTHGHTMIRHNKQMAHQIAILLAECETNQHNLYRNVVNLYVKIQKLENPDYNHSANEICICDLFNDRINNQSYEYTKRTEILQILTPRAEHTTEISV